MRGAPWKILRYVTLAIMGEKGALPLVTAVSEQLTTPVSGAQYVSQSFARKGSS